MKRRVAPGRKPRKKKVVELPPMPLVQLDSAHLRQEASREYNDVLRELEKARAALDHFQQQDIPKFTRWMHSQFGALLTQIRETSLRLREQHLLLIEIEREVMYNGTSHFAAYEQVMERRRKAQAGEVDDPPGSAKDKHRDPEPDPDEEPDPEFEEPGPEFFDDFDQLGANGRKHSGHKPSTGAARLKELYRAVVRRLHPDTQKEMTPQKLEWWHQAQDAYQNGNVEQLETILSLCEIEDAGTSEKTSLSVLKRLIQQFKNSLRQIEHQIFKSRRDPAWNFSRRKEFGDLENAIRRQLTHDLRIMKEELLWVEQQIADWATPDQPGRRYPTYLRRRGGGMGFF